MSDVDREVPPSAPTPPENAAPPKQSIGYQSRPRAGGAVIDFADDGVSIRINYEHGRAWGLVIGFGLFAFGVTAFIVYTAIVHGAAAVSATMIFFAVLLALLALAAAIKGGTPPLHLIATARSLRMHGGIINEDVEWRRDEILAVTAEDIDQAPAQPPRISILIEFRDDEFAVFPVATHEEQAAIVQALRSALKLPEPEPAPAPST